jgi:hypothetical protein
LGAVFAVLCAIAGIWSGVKMIVVYWAVYDSLPPQFQDPLMSRYAFSTYALNSSTPLSVQTDHMKSLVGGCFAMLFFSLSCFTFGRPDGGLLALAGFLAITVGTIKSWKTYKENCSRAQQA